MVISIFTLMISTLLLSLPEDCDCITDVNDPKIQRIILSLKEKWDTFKSIDVRYLHIEENKDNNRFAQLNVHFKFQGSNFYRAYTLPAEAHYRNRKSQDKTISPDPNIDTPRNLLEVFLKKANKNKVRSRTPSLEDSEFVTTKVYSYNDKFYFRAVHEYKTGEKYIIAFPIPGDNCETNAVHVRHLWGATPSAFKDERCLTPYPLHEFFELKGRTCYREKDGYRILWHEAFLDYERNLEAWFDEENNLVKLRDVSYLVRTYYNDIEKIRAILGKEVSCDFPEILQSEVIYSDFHPIWKIPMRLDLTTYRRIFPESADPYLQKMFDEYKSGKIPRVEALSIWLATSIGNRERLKTTIIVDKDSLKVNVPINEEEFIPVSPNKGYDFHDLEDKDAARTMADSSAKPLVTVIKQWIKNPPITLVIGMILIMLLIILLIYFRFFLKKRNIHVHDSRFI